MFVPLEPQSSYIHEKLNKRWREYCAAAGDMDIPPMGYTEWLEVVTFASENDQQSVAMYAASVASDICKYFEGRIFAPPTANEDIFQWITGALGHENAAYYKVKVQAEEYPHQLEMKDKLLAYAVRQIKTIAEAYITHSERRGALKILALDLEGRHAASSSDYPPGRAESVDDIPF